MNARRTILVVLLLLPVSVPAVEKAVPQNQLQIQLSYAPVVRRAAPAVVNIFTREPDVTAQNPVKDSPAYKRLFADDDVSEQNPLGSGAIVDPGGTIVTNEHVIRGAGPVTVVLNDRRQFPATIVRADERTDLAVLRINAGEPLPYLEIRDSDELQVGDIVLAIGNPFGIGQTVTSGIVSALARTVNAANDERTFIQTDAAINPGNSGGPLVSLDGRLVGINTALYSEGGGFVGLGFAIPTSLVRAVLDATGAGQRLVRPWLGAKGRTVTVRTAMRLGLARVSGVVIEDVWPGGPADLAGLRPGDVILSVDGRPIDDTEALRFRYDTLPIGGTGSFTVWHDGQQRELSVRLTPPPETPRRDVTQLRQGQLSGVTVANLSPALADELETAESSGIIVLDVPRNSVAWKGRLAVGDIVAAVNGQAVTTVSDLLAAAQHTDSGTKLGLRRNGRSFQITLAP
ncbi:MAG TPA: trypsin-like peptidase domain-containing protein [Stellaceae bacterium]|nr:trypsin-like peptidase domain-containing protein [Stellaceae bacterium]